MVFISFLSTAYYPVPAHPISAMAGEAPPPPHPPRLESHFYRFDIGSREQNYAVFQQNPIVVTAQLDAPMDSDAVITQAQSSIHLLKPFFLRLPRSCRVAEKSDPIAHFSGPDLMQKIIQK